ncbi:MAG: DUF4105 domain-containing protein [Flavobacterium sp.]|nr:MAG: DUF4105 domain-containing protein [Flavobacterium sp.]
MRRFSLLFLLFLLSPMAWSQMLPLSKDAKVSVLTCGTGPEIYALFGHTAIRIKDPSQHLDEVYNYGAFDFDTPNFALKFVKGDMQYFATSGAFYDFMMQYNYEQRSVSEQVLDIPLEKRQLLFDKLNAVLTSDKRFYTYKFIDRNCTNMASDIINETLGSRLIFKRKNTDTTYRSIIFPYFNGHFYEQWGTSVLFGTKVDEKATTLFLPSELEQSLDLTVYNGKPLVAKRRFLFNAGPQPVPTSIWNNIYTYLIILALVVLLNKKGLTAFYLILIGILGVLFSFNGLYSLHEELSMNYNVLLFNPLLILSAIFYLRNNARGMYIWSIANFVCLGIYLVIVFGKAHFLVVLPMIIAHVIILTRIAVKSQRTKIA